MRAASLPNLIPIEINGLRLTSALEQEVNLRIGKSSYVQPSQLGPPATAALAERGEATIECALSVEVP